MAIANTANAVSRFRLAYDLMMERGFVPMSVPVIVREGAMRGTGYFPLGREQAYAMSNEEPPVFLSEGLFLQGPVYHVEKYRVVIDRFHDVVVSAKTERLYGGKGRCVAADDDHVSFRV